MWVHRTAATSRSSTRRRSLPVILLTVLMLLGASEAALANLLITPQRMVLGPRDRSGEFRLMNQSSETMTYRIVWRQLRMTETGGLIEVEEDAPGAASALIRYSPRSVTLAPGEVQLVRMQVRRPADLPDGEYVSHMAFVPVPNLPEGEVGGEGVRMELKLSLAMSMPVIVRHGEVSATAALALTGLEPTPPRVVLQLDRSGTASVYGNFEVYLRKPDGKAEVIGRLNGAAIYANIAQRQFKIPLFVDDIAALKGSIVQAVLRDPAKPDAVLAQAAANIQ